jgi:hypothetical protein
MVLHITEFQQVNLELQKPAYYRIGRSFDYKNTLYVLWKFSTLAGLQS